jgi:hypothetical protein
VQPPVVVIPAPATQQPVIVIPAAPPQADLTTAVTDKAKASMLRELGVALLLLSPAILTMAFLSLPSKRAASGAKR